jgi:hypothetical protein
MNSEKWSTIKTILAQALSCSSHPERSAFVAQSCAGNSLLKDEIETLLAHADELFRDDVLIHELGTRLTSFSRSASLERLKSTLKSAAEARRLLLIERPCGYGG